jgi:hypothetical protein
MDGMPFFNHRFILAFFGKQILLQVETNPLAFVQKFPLTMANPPHRSCPTILCIQCCSAKKGSLTAVLLFI